MPKQFWSKERIVEKIKQIHSEQGDLRPSNPAIKALVEAGTRYFGSWRNACLGANINYETLMKDSKNKRSNKLKKWTKEEIIRKIIELKRQEEDLTAQSVMKKYLSIYTYARRPDYFGSWKKALAAAGISYSEVKTAALKKPIRMSKKRWLKSLVIDEIIAIGGKDGVEADEPYLEKNYTNFYHLVMKLFGKWETVDKEIKRHLSKE